MAYTAPPSSAVNFTVGGYYEPGRVRHAFKFPSGNYAQPNGDAVHFVLSSYVYPNGLVANITVPANVNVEGVGAVTVDITAEGHFVYVNTAIDGTGSATIDITAEGTAKHGMRCSADVAIDLSLDAVGKHGVRTYGEVEVPLTPTGLGVVVRYEVRGEVRLQGVLVNRRVRTYNRASGQLIGDTNTVAGKFKVHAGFSPEEHYIVPIDLASDAEDWLPPCANRVVSVLASDTI